MARSPVCQVGRQRVFQLVMSSDSTDQPDVGPPGVPLVPDDIARTALSPPVASHRPLTSEATADATSLTDAPHALDEKTGPAASEDDAPSQPAGSERPVRRFKIGSQRPEGFKPRLATRPAPVPPFSPPAPIPGSQSTPSLATPPPAPIEQESSGPQVQAQETRKSHGPKPRIDRPPSAAVRALTDRPIRTAELPNLRAGLAPDLEDEFAAAISGVSLEQALQPGGLGGAELEPESRHQARVVGVHRDQVFVELGGKNQGTIPLAQFAKPPELGQTLEVQVTRLDVEDGLYQLTVPGSAVDVSGWSELSEGMTVEARVTGHNKGGLECEVNHIRGFIPAGQIGVYRVEDFAQFAGEKFACIVMEVNPEKRNLVLSRRAVVEREKEASRRQLLAELAEGHVREGIVRKLTEFGAFVDLGGLDGLIHVSQMSWHRVKHPSEILEVGQPVKVMVKRIDPESHRISLTLRDLIANPWTGVEHKYPVSTLVSGRVTRIEDFGAFVELEPGVEGLVHISELAHGRVWRASDVVAVGQEVEAKVLSIDAAQQRIGLSIKAVLARPEPTKKAEAEQTAEAAEAAPTVPRHQGPLKGGINRKSSGGKFGLKW